MRRKIALFVVCALLVLGAFANYHEISDPAYKFTAYARSHPGYDMAIAPKANNPYLEVDAPTTLINLVGINIAGMFLLAVVCLAGGLFSLSATQSPSIAAELVSKPIKAPMSPNGRNQKIEVALMITFSLAIPFTVFYLEGLLNGLSGPEATGSALGQTLVITAISALVTIPFPSRMRFYVCATGIGALSIFFALSNYRPQITPSPVPIPDWAQGPINIDSDNEKSIPERR